jgi:hypothetical protein
VVIAVLVGVMVAIFVPRQNTSTVLVAAAVCARRPRSKLSS